MSFYFVRHFALIYSFLQQCLDGQHSCISCRRSGFNSPFAPTNFQLSFFSFSYIWGHQTFLFNKSNLRNHPSFRCSEGRVISHIKGLTYYYRALVSTVVHINATIIIWLLQSCIYLCDASKCFVVLALGSHVDFLFGYKSYCFTIQ